MCTNMLMNHEPMGRPSMDEWQTIVHLFHQCSVRADLFHSEMDALSLVMANVSQCLETHTRLSEENAALRQQMIELGELNSLETRDDTAGDFRQTFKDLHDLFSSMLQIKEKMKIKKEKPKLAQPVTRSTEKRGTAPGTWFESSTDEEYEDQYATEANPQFYHGFGARYTEETCSNLVPADMNQAAAFSPQMQPSATWSNSSQYSSQEDEVQGLLPDNVTAHVATQHQGLPPPDQTFPIPVTTFIIRNIPARYTKERLLEEWVVDGSFNFLHLPYDFVKKRFRGFAFINFTTEQHATDFCRAWDGAKLRHHGNSCALQFFPAHTQGFWATARNVQEHVSDRVRGEKYLPSVFMGTRAISFRAVMKHQIEGPATSGQRPYQSSERNRPMERQALHYQSFGNVCH